MTYVHQNQPDQIHIKREEDDISIKVVTLKQSATPYAAGTVVVEEFVNSASTGLYVDAASVSVDTYTTVHAAILRDRVYAVDGNHDAVTTFQIAEIYGALTSLATLVTAKKAAVAAALALNHVVVR